MKRNGIIALVLFLGLLFTVVVGLAFNYRLSIESFTLAQLTDIIGLLNMIGVLRDVLTIALFGVLVVETGMLED